ncbi:hypothetical protein CkaCkLH20_02297 [Colletotrichum karsti]|uniref:Thiamine pyrophosphokinase n=1 Tax=Colletotrichum karsti TaxID=1095194 RepID=A0A9P6IAY3_9PEZI|nr:uncharacterized protein CkaCkLH20_02297 [Colletotrichum karsti]KAF9880343.1 hypothetical protein CkaCkLH20_02297 [Colletotrichum karsti]
MSLSTKSSEKPPKFTTLLELVHDANKFRPQRDNWTFCLYTYGRYGSQRWRPFGVVLPEVVNWLKLADIKDLKFFEREKRIHLLPPIYSGTNNLEEAWNEILHKLDEAGEHERAKGAEVPDWVSFKTKYTYTKHTPENKELWTLIGAGRGYEYGILVDLVPIFGVATSGAHLNVYTNTEEGVKVYVSTRPEVHPNFPGLLDQIVAGGFTPDRHGTIKDCISQESKQEAKGLPKDSNARIKGYPCIQFFDIRDDRWEKGHASLPEPGIRKPYDLEVTPDEAIAIKPKEGQQRFELMTIEEIVATLRNGDWKPNCALIMIDFMIRHNLMPDQKESGDVEEIKRLLRLKDHFQEEVEIPVIELARITNQPHHLEVD